MGGSGGDGLSLAPAGGTWKEGGGSEMTGARSSAACWNKGQGKTAWESWESWGAGLGRGLKYTRPRDGASVGVNWGINRRTVQSKADWQAGNMDPGLWLK